MNINKAAILLALGLGTACALSAPSFAADAPAKAPAKKPAAAAPAGPGPCGSEPMPGHGMMDGMMGHGMGGGPMGGMGGGMMGGDMMMESPRMHMVRALDLSDEQRAKINKLTDDLHHANWERMGMIQDEAAKLRDLYEADKRDPKAITAEYRKIFDVKLQMIEAMLDTQNHVEDLLTPDQQAKLKAMHHSMPMHGYPMH